MIIRLQYVFTLQGHTCTNLNIFYLNNIYTVIQIAYDNKSNLKTIKYLFVYMYICLLSNSMAKLNCVLLKKWIYLTISININKNPPELVPSPPLSAIENILITEQDVSYWFLDIRMFKKNPVQDYVTLIITVCLQITSQSCDRFLSSRRPSCVIIYLANPFQIWCKASLAKGKLKL